MLFTQTVSPECYTLIRDLLQIPDLKNFRLVGGTALALQKGHRKSIDIDLFSDAEFNSEKILQALEAYLFPRRATEVRIYPFGFFCTIEEIKSDFMYWGDAFVKPYVVTDGIRMSSSLELFAMKLQAITSRKVKKDFFDIAFLLDEYSLQEGLVCYREKYPYDDFSVVLKQLVYLDGAENTPEPDMLIPLSWTEVKTKITEAVKAYWNTRI